MHFGYRFIVTHPVYVWVGLRNVLYQQRFLVAVWAMQRRIDIEFDREFQLHTSYHNDFFLLRTKVLVDGKSTEIRSVSEEGRYDGPALKVCRSGSTGSTKLWRIENAISPILHRCGVYHVDTFYYEKSPLFHTVFTSKSCLRKFLLAMGEVKSALETQLHYLLSRNLKSTQCHVPETDSSQQLTIEVQPELFLVSPNHQKTKGADLHLITIENCSDHLTHWKSSKLFEFSSLYQEEGMSQCSHSFQGFSVEMSEVLVQSPYGQYKMCTDVTGQNE